MAEGPKRQDVRELILARRAAFVASALGAAGLVASPARSQPLPTDPADPSRAPGQPPALGAPPPMQIAVDGMGRSAADPTLRPIRILPLSQHGERHGFRCPPPRQLDEKTSQAASAHRARSARLVLEEHFTEALAELIRAWALTADLQLLLIMGQIELKLGNPARAREIFERYLACTPHHDNDVQMAMTAAQVKQLSAETGRVLIELGVANAEIWVDSAQVATTPWPEPIYLTAGQHSFEARLPDGERVVGDIAVEPGSDQILTLHRLRQSEPMPCLQPCLQPCLSVHPCLEPPHNFDDDRRLGLNLGLALAPKLHLQLPGDELEAFGGGAAAVFVNGGISRTIELRLSAFGAPTGGEDGAVVPLGGSLSMTLSFSSWAAVETGAATGYLFAPEPERAPSGGYEPSSSWFIEPFLSPLTLRFDRIEVSPRFSLLFSTQQSATDERFGLSYLSPSLWISYLFLSGDPYNSDGEDG